MKTQIIRVFLCWLSVAGWAAAQPMEEALPKLPDLPLPTAEQLLNDRPVDWVVLFNDDVLIADPVTPRPDTLKKIEELVTQKEAQRGRATGEARDAMLKEIEKANQLYLTLPHSTSNLEYQIPYKRVREIRYHEDMVLERIKLLLEQQDIAVALELLTRLQRTAPGWPGSQDAYHNILFADAGKRLAAGAPQAALIPLDELYQRAKDFPGLPERTGEATRLLVQQALDANDTRRAQFHLRRLQRRYADHPVYQQFANQLAQQTRTLLQQAVTLHQQGDYREATLLAEEAARRWPRSTDLRTQFRIPADRWQRLHVGVSSLPGENRAYPFPSAADLRKRVLTELPLFEIDRVRDGTTYYRTRFFDEWEPLHLGREMRFTLKQFRQPFEMQGVVGTPDVVGPILQRLDPQDPRFDERLSSFIESVIVESPTEFRLVFRRVPPRLEPLLARIALTKPDDEADAIGPVSETGGFRETEQTANQATYLRVIPEPSASKRYHVAEVIEHRYDTPEKAVQGFQLGDVSLLPGLPDWIIRRMQNDSEFQKAAFILPEAIPITHVLQFNPASAPLRVRELRSALAYAVDRDRLLRDVILRDPSAAHGHIVTTPFPADSPARNVLITPRRYDLSAAMAMGIAASRQLKQGLPQLTMIVAPGEEVEEAARQMAATWKRIGINVQLVFAHEPAPDHWDILYRTMRMPEPLVDMWPFLTFQEQARLADLNVYPDWLKQELVELDRTSDPSRAIGGLQTLHRHLSEDTTFVPLWEVDQFLVVRKNISGFPRRLIHCYDKIDQWTIDPWYQPELP